MLYAKWMLLNKIIHNIKSRVGVGRANDWSERDASALKYELRTVNSFNADAMTFPSTASRCVAAKV
jgi:hypothetical protein